MTGTLFIAHGNPATDNPTTDSVPVTWDQPAWATKTEADDGYCLHFGPWIVTNPDQHVHDQVSARLSASDEFNLLPDGTAVASRTITVEIRIGGERSMEQIALGLADSSALAEIIHTLTETARTGRSHD